MLTISKLNKWKLNLKTISTFKINYNLQSLSKKYAYMGNWPEINNYRNNKTSGSHY